jgi:hypothetical protein
MEIDSSRIIFFSDKTFTFEYSEFGGLLFIHCNVSSWKLSVLKRMYKVFGEFVNTISGEFYTITPNPRFAKLFGGEVVRTATLNGIKYEVIKWELIQSP